MSIDKEVASMAVFKQRDDPMLTSSDYPATSSIGTGGPLLNDENDVGASGNTSVQ